MRISAEDKRIISLNFKGLVVDRFGAAIIFLLNDDHFE